MPLNSFLPNSKGKTRVELARPLFTSLAVCHEASPHSAPLNMAIDEAILEWTGGAVLRFYRWERQSVSFGYFGQFAEVARHQPDREIVRRWTGGGIVLHGDDITYSAIIPAAEPLARMSSPQLYGALHATICQALRRENLPARLATGDAAKISNACFANAVRSDVLLGDRKVAGAAQRRTRRGVLHQGSIGIPDLPGDFRQRLASAFCSQGSALDLPTALLVRAKAIAERKYATSEWLLRR